MSRTLTITGMIVIISMTALLPTFASTKGRQNTALVLTGATVYSALKKNDKAAIVGAVVSAQAWKNYEDSRKRDSRKAAYARRHKYHRHSSNGRRHAYGHYKNCKYYKR